MTTTKNFRDICLTIGTIGIVTISALFFVTLITSLKIGKFSLFVCLASALLITVGLSRQNRAKIKNLFTSKGLL